MYTGNGWYHDGIITRDLWASSDGTSLELILGSKLMTLLRSSSSCSMTGSWQSKRAYGVLVTGQTGIWNWPPFHSMLMVRSTYNDVWASEDGIAWQKIVENAPWEHQMLLTVAVYKIWVLGGFSNKDNHNFT